MRIRHRPTPVALDFTWLKRSNEVARCSREIAALVNEDGDVSLRTDLHHLSNGKHEGGGCILLAIDQRDVSCTSD